MRLENLVVFFCLAITLHNIEEALWLPRWPKRALRFQKPVTSQEFHFAVIVITALAYLSAFSYLYAPEFDGAKWLFTGFLGSMIVNAFFPHLLITVLMKRYAPGLLTGLLLNVPINSLLIHRMLGKNLISWSELLFSTVVVGIALLALIPLLFKIGGKVLPISSDV